MNVKKAVNGGGPVGAGLSAHRASLHAARARVVT